MKQDQLIAKYRETLALCHGTDLELAQLAHEELAQIEDQLLDNSKYHRNCILEVRPGTGGDEAELFAAQLLKMYTRYAELSGWKVNPVEVEQSELGGLKIGVLEIKGAGAYQQLRFESGVHRVQRVPKTEKSGRIHTSAATVAVLPEASKVDVELKSAEIRMDFYRSGGKGGQNVNKLSTAVRLTHLPTGIVVAVQNERSQAQNREKAEAILRSRMLEHFETQAQSQLSANRKALVGTGDRSEKIRTYNFPQDRITDHRINQSWSRIEKVLSGELQPVIEELAKVDRAAQLEQLLLDSGGEQTSQLGPN